MGATGLLDRAWRVLVSMRTSAVLLAALSALMFVNVLVPQQGVSKEAYDAMVSRGGGWRFLVETAGLGHVSTSGIFQTLLWLFFASLTAVLLERTGSTLRRLRVRAPTEAQLRALFELEHLPVATDRGWSPDAARSVLEGLGYRVVPAGERALWAVKNPAALLGFPLFHLSFFILCAAGLQLYFTRDVGLAIVTEGQRVQGGDLRVERRAPAGAPPAVDLVLERLDVELERGIPTGAAASLQSLRPGEPQRVARVNFPAEWGSLAVLVDRVGLAPVLRLTDEQGFTIDKVGVVVHATPGGTTVALADGRLAVTMESIPVGPGFPQREELPRARLRTRIQEGARVVWEGPLAAGEPVRTGAGVLVMEELRYWALLRFVHERGGPLLVLGFTVLVAGIVWRMVWFRREVAVAWDGSGARLAGRGEFYPARFRDELASLRVLLEEPGRVGIARRT